MAGDDRVPPARHFVGRLVRRRFRRTFTGCCRSPCLVWIDCQPKRQPAFGFWQMRTKHYESIPALNSRTLQAFISYGSQIAIDYGPVRLSLPRFEITDRPHRPARSCGALNPSPLYPSGILQIVRTKNEFSQIAQLRLGTSRTRRMLHSIQKRARVDQRSIILNRHSFQVRFEMVLSQRYCEHTPQQEACDGSECCRHRHCGSSGEYVFLLFLHKHLASESRILRWVWRRYVIEVLGFAQQDNGGFMLGRSLLVPCETGYRGFNKMNSVITLVDSAHYRRLP